MGNVNFSMRDIDVMNIQETATFNRPRGFFPLYAMDIKNGNKLPESKIINGAANVTLSKRFNFILPDVPYIKNNFDTRLMYSDIHINDAFKNGFRVFYGTSYQDLPKTYGALVSVQELNGNLICVMENGVILVPVNERVVGGEGDGGNVYINTNNILPENPRVLSPSFGSMWKESIIFTTGYLYGVDTMARKIWRTNGESFEIISDLKVQKFLNDNITLNESDKQIEVGVKNVKTHYNAFKGDLMFTFYKHSNGVNKEWNLCYNEKLEKFITFYTWTPSYSENINNVFFSFDLRDHKKPININHTSNLWKHGQAGVYDLQAVIKPTNWYGDPHKFEFEFIVKEFAQVQKIFNNLKLVSNKAIPESFVFEVVGEAYEFYDYKDEIKFINDRVPSLYPTLDASYKAYLLSTEALNKNIKKLPYIQLNTPIAGNTVFIKNDPLLNENKLNVIQEGRDIKILGILKGNMQYLEDLWNIEIKPITFKYAYINSSNNLDFTASKQMPLRDKYIKIRVKYSGLDLAIIQSINNIFTISYA
jgi:hypothetical protein